MQNADSHADTDHCSSTFVATRCKFSSNTHRGVGSILYADHETSLTLSRYTVFKVNPFKSDSIKEMRSV